MAKHTIITDFGNCLVDILRRELVPDIIQNPDAIGLCSPSDKGDFTVGVHLYDVRESEEIRTNSMVSSGEEELKYPPVYVSLYYMITTYSAGDIKFRSSEEQKVLGRIVQVFNDFQCFNQDTLKPSDIQKPMDIIFKMHNIELEEKMRAFSVPNGGYKLSLFYKAAPIEIESRKTKRIQRVRDIDVTIHKQEGR